MMPTIQLQSCGMISIPQRAADKLRPGFLDGENYWEAAFFVFQA
jgi:hypothetical protein